MKWEKKLDYNNRDYILLQNIYDLSIIVQP